jgi:hypothetical protein
MSTPQLKEKFAEELGIGDYIAEVVSDAGKVVKGTHVRSLSYGIGCGGVHVNENACWDRAQPLTVATFE